MVRHADTRRHMETHVDTWRHIEVQRANWGRTDETQTHLATQTTCARPRDVPSHVSHVSRSWTEILEVRAQPGENKNEVWATPRRLDDTESATSSADRCSVWSRWGHGVPRAIARNTSVCQDRVDSTCSSPRCFSAHNCTNNCALRDENIVLRYQKEFFECTHSIENVVLDIMSVVACDGVCEISCHVETVRL